MMKRQKLRDLDPESLLDPAPDSSDDNHSNSDFSDADDANAGREHYEDVGKSRLRKKEVVPLGPQYSGSSISRVVAEDDDSDDPFARGYKAEDSEDDGHNDDSEGSGDTEDIAFRDPDRYIEEEGHDTNEEEEEQVVDGESDTDEDMLDGFGNESDEDEDEERDLGDTSEDELSDSEPEHDDADRATKVRELMKDTKSLTGTLSVAAQEDIAKGDAVKGQRRTFDSLLNCRIRLQKSLIATNTMAASCSTEELAPNASVEAAEAAALNLLTTLTGLRASLDEARTGQKRKRPVFNTTTPSVEIWNSITSSEGGAMPHRKATLEKWSKKTKGAAVSSSRGRLNASVQQTLTDVLDSQVSNPSLITRTQTPRSCAPTQASSQSRPDPSIYDDADFYGVLLQALLEQRSADLAGDGGAEVIVQAPWQLAREAKTKKAVDTKASKGRRLRYTVNEKLQNFLAPEDRNQWGDRQGDELFSSLFGQRLGLGEHDEVESEDDGLGEDAEEQGLMLFRS